MLYKTLLRRCGQVLLDVAAPCYCALCGQPSQRALDLCVACQQGLPWLGSACRRCALPLARDAELCGQCLRRAPAISETIAACRYAPPVAGFIHQLKYRGDLSRVALLAELMSTVIARRPGMTQPPDFLVPMPLHWRRRWRRGFNQADELARALCRDSKLQALSLQVNRKLCRRVKATAPQQQLQARQRRHNLQDAFQPRGEVAGLELAIIDDVMTTGASANSLAQVLLDAGARRVSLWCVARTADPRSIGAMPD
ncbi:MAG: ComF family protein [Halieaceae bacterium]